LVSTVLKHCHFRSQSSNSFTPTKGLSSRNERTSQIMCLRTDLSWHDPKGVAKDRSWEILHIVVHTFTPRLILTATNRKFAQIYDNAITSWKSRPSKTSRLSFVAWSIRVARDLLRMIHDIKKLCVLFQTTNPLRLLPTMAERTGTAESRFHYLSLRFPFGGITR
jgi:hypothetical protein